MLREIDRVAVFLSSSDEVSVSDQKEHLLRAKTLEAQFPEIEQEAETAFEALKAGAAKARWAVAAPPS